MRNIFSILFIFVALFSPVHEALFAQQGKGSVKGFVRDSTTGEALSLANVIVKGIGQGAATDSRGFYFISNIRPGKIVLRVSLVGYASKEVNVEIVAGKVATANIRLAPVVYESGVVTATAQRRARYDTEISTQPIGSTEIEIVPAAVEADLFRTLSILPGVVSTSDVTSQFYVRGGSGDQNMIILDGMTIYNPFHALGLFSIFDADAVKEAEVLKGGFPAQYGNRLSSIINIKTREGNSRRLAGKVSASFLSVKASAEGPTPWDGAWIVSARKSTFNDVLKKFVRTDVPFDFYDVIARANMETGDAGRLSVHMLLSGDQIIQANPKSADYFWDNRGYSLTWFQVLENRYFIDASVSFSSFKGELRPKAESELSRRLSEVEEVYFNGTINYFRDDGDSYGAGFMFRLPRYHFAFTNASNFDRDVITRNSETGLWFKYKFKQLYPFMAEVGFRSDITAILGTENSEAFEPRVSMTYVVSNDVSVKASYSRVHQRSITITNEDDIVSLFEIWIPVPEELPAEQADHFIAGIEGDIPLVPGLNFNLQGYLKNFNSLVDYNRDKVDATDPDFSEGRGSSYGVEFFIEERSPVYYGWLSYTYSVTSITTGSLTYFPRYDRRHSLNIVLGWKPGNGWDFNLRWEYGSGLPFTRIVGFYDRLLLSGLFESSGYGNEPGVPYTILGKKNDGRLPAFHRLDLSAAKTFYLDPIRITVEANVINAYDRDNMFYFDRNTGERVDMLPFLATATLRIAY